ncbi:MAG: lysophospholipid acyltransferase family protein [Desulfobacteraceae bacterium]|jgi:1-acyl-sn-glycerol-3-phosphate acyltransferase|nr:lysophospholipid acyltransferase family protein [Desulfobacteraceae bacterium]
MVNLKFLDNINLVTSPWGQKFMAHAVLGPNYHLFARVKIKMEHIENIPKGEPVIFAMNHTDRFNYWPFQYKLWSTKDYPFTTVWVKGTYFNNKILGQLLKLCNTFPVPSKGYLIREQFKKTYRRTTTRDEYRMIKDVLDNKISLPDVLHSATREVRDLLSENWDRMSHAGASFLQFIENNYYAMMERVAQLSISALFEKKLSIIIFPEGTRSVKLAEGRNGIAQLALHSEKAVIPVGCNGSERVYPGSSPIAKSGTITYRVGKPMTVHDDFKDFRIKEKFNLFSKESQQKYRQAFDAATQVIMQNIDSLLDDRYRVTT